MRKIVMLGAVVAAIVAAQLGAAQPASAAVYCIVDNICIDPWNQCPAMIGTPCGGGPLPGGCTVELQRQGTYIAGYPCNTPVSSLSYYKDWANLRQNQCGARLSIAAWHWTGAGWSKRYLPGGTRVYVWPFAVDWSWVWTQASGWLAVRDVNIVVNQWMDPLVMCPISSDVQRVD